MATKPKSPLTGPTPVAKERIAEVKQAAKQAPADDAPPTMTHQGPGSGKAGAVDPSAASAILTKQQGSATATTAASPAPDLRARVAEAEVKLTPGTEQAPGTAATIPTPGRQANDSGIKTGADPGSGSQSQGESSATSQLDAAVEDAVGKLAASRANIKGPMDVFEAAASTTTAPGGAAAGASSPAPAVDDLFGNSGDGGEQHTAEVVGQLTSGGGSLFGGRLAFAQQELAIGAGLIGDQRTRESSPNVAHGSNPLSDAVNSVTPEDRARAAEAAGVTPDSGSPSVPGGFKFQKAGYGFGSAAEAEAASEKGWMDRAVDFIKEASAPTNVNQARQLHEVEDGIGTTTDSQTVAEGHEEQGIKNLETAVGKVMGSAAGGDKGGGVQDPGSPDGEGGRPTQAEMAFRQALHEALGIRRVVGGDVDPADESAPGGMSGPVADLPNNSESLIGNPGTPDGQRGTGSAHPSPGGTDIDPLEGSAFSGAALGGNPEDLDFGNGSLGIDTARRSSSTDDDDEEEEDDEEDKDEA
ncbi:MAG: hypothetical protein IPN07_03050 [Dehalococcoidia bacterium]|nr:hypothetical protein [Dehalococcoidia bacterium]